MRNLLKISRGARGVNVGGYFGGVECVRSGFGGGFRTTGRPFLPVSAVSSGLVRQISQPRTALSYLG
jgi:hypothetical protein